MFQYLKNAIITLFAFAILSTGVVYAGGILTPSPSHQNNQSNNSDDDLDEEDDEDDDVLILEEDVDEDDEAP